MAKIVCDKCESVFQFEVVKNKNMKNCPVCGELLFGGGNELDEEVEKPDFRHPDLYYYVIEREDEYEYEDRYLRDIWCNCTACREINRISYNKFVYVIQE